MQNKEENTIIWAVMAMIVLALLNITQYNYYECKTVLQQNKLPVKQVSVLSDTEYYANSSLIEVNERTAEDREPQENIPEAAISEETIPLEAIIDLEKVDKTVLDKLKYEAANEKEIVTDFIRDDKIIMDKAESYSAVKGVTCFRGNNYRDSASYGHAVIEDKKLEIQWQIPTGGIDNWTGVGWNGQPSIVQ
ncbi:MAG TPA: hypothetical protein VEF53_01825, partial [Patescibacteria group bacterium]|nr:hypothetical protein [Patescibacteria group bacterium]